MNVRFIASLIVIAVLGAGAVYLHRELGSGGGASAAEQGEGEAGGAPQGMPPTAVEAKKVRVGKVVQTIRAIGTLRSEESVVISSEIAGRVRDILVEEGQRVPKDAPLVILDSSIYEAQLAQAQASLALNRANTKRAESLRERGTGTQLAVDEAAAALRADQAAIALAQAWLDKATLYAPFEGILGLRQVSIGEYVQPGQAIFTLEAVDRLKADFRIPEVSVQKIKVNQTIELTTDAIPGERFTGTVYAIDPKVDPEGRNLVVRALVPNTEGLLRPGLFVRVDLIIGERDDAILIPEQALVPVGDDLFVYRVVDGKAVFTQVLAGQRREGEVEITEGLTPEDVVIFEGQIKIGDGAPVQVVTDQGQGQGGEAGQGGGEQAPAAQEQGQAAPSEEGGAS